MGRGMRVLQFFLSVGAKTPGGSVSNMQDIFRVGNGFNEAAHPAKTCTQRREPVGQWQAGPCCLSLAHHKMPGHGKLL